MMASNIISRLLPNQSGSPSIYETLRRHDESDSSDLEERAGLALDEENLGENYQHFDLDDAATTAADSHIILGSRLRSPSKTSPRTTKPRHPRKAKTGKTGRRPKWMQGSPGLLGVDEADDEVPPSLLIEDAPNTTHRADAHLDLHDTGDIPIPEPITEDIRQRWESTQAHQRLHSVDGRAQQPSARIPMHGPSLAFADPKEKAMWRWANVENLDNFLNEVYVYFLGNGIWSIVLHRALNFLTLGFVVGFSVFLSNCIDYREVRNSQRMSQIRIPQCMSKMSSGATFMLWLLCLLWLWKLIQSIMDFRRLRSIHDFYFYLLGVSDVDLQTISWQEVVSRLMTLRDANPATAAAVSTKHRRFLGSQSKQRMDAHDIANRLMRKENYLIALFNKEILDLTLPVPFVGKRQLLSRALMWNIDHCILDFVFDKQGQVHTTFLKDTYRADLSNALRKRFLFAGIMNLFTAPFLMVYFMMLYFFRYFNEWQKDPSEIGSRQYTLLAKWKFREFNELHHLFKRRTDMSYPFAARYVGQFPKDKTIQLCRFVSFIAGALAGVLLLATVIDPELFLGFELTTDRTVLFYLGIFTTIWAVSRGMVPEENLVFDPEYALQEVIDFTHYNPAHWSGRLHSDEVRREFAALYQMKVVVFLEEILSMIFTPFILCFSLPQCSERVIDFFREFTVHVDGLGYVCSFAVFEFKKNGNAAQPPPNGQPAATYGTGLRDDYYATKDQKLEASYWGFMNDYARNPKTGIPFLPTSSRRKLNPPPPFPALMSPKLPAEVISGVRHDRWDRVSGRPSPSGALDHHTGYGPTSHHGGVAASSLLLDPQHQPSSSGIRPPLNTRAVNTNTRYRPDRNQFGITAEAEEEEEDGVETKRSETSMEQSAVGSHLGESWKMNEAGSVDDEEEVVEDGMRAVTGDQGTGVLGMIVQFQKAQTERRGMGTINL